MYWDIAAEHWQEGCADRGRAGSQLFAHPREDVVAGERGPDALYPGCLHPEAVDMLRQAEAAAGSKWLGAMTHEPLRNTFYMIPVDVVPRVSAGRLVIGI